MSKKGSITTADYLAFNYANRLISMLLNDGKPQMALLMGTMLYTGLRISDTLKLKWSDLINQEILIITEQKTGKTRKIGINPVLQKLAKKVRNKLGIKDNTQFIFISRKKVVYNKSSIIAKFKIVQDRYGIEGNFSSHSLRKSFGRRIYEMSAHKDYALAQLMRIFKHSSQEETLCYLGIREEEINNIYMSL